jgi:hypothetical protein
MWMSSRAREKTKGALGDLARDRVQPRDDLRRIGRRDDALIGEHPGMRLAPGDVLAASALSKSIEALISSMIAAGASLKSPPHILLLIGPRSQNGAEGGAHDRQNENAGGRTGRGRRRGGGSIRDPRGSRQRRERRLRRGPSARASAGPRATGEVAAFQIAAAPADLPLWPSRVQRASRQPLKAFQAKSPC